MSKLDLAIAKHTTTQGPMCAVGRLKLDRSAAARDIIAKIENEGIQATALARAIPDAYPDYAMPYHAIQRHRRGDCKCPRP